MTDRMKSKLFAILFFYSVVLQVVDTLLQRNNVCKTFEGYYTNKDCYYNPDQKLDVPGIVKRHGFSFEKHKVTTEDGYILTVFRIPSKDPNSNPVLLQHAILASSINFLVIGNDSLGFVLANENYDVWLGNFRGTKYSRKHKYLKTDDIDYWNFSFDELGAYDIKSTVDFISKTTKKPITYIGYSLGAVAGHVYSSVYPEESEHNIKVMISMAPGTMIETSRSVLRYFRPFWGTLQKSILLYNHGEFFPRDDPLIKYVRSVCFPYPHQLKMCLGLVQLAFGINEDQINPETLPITLYHDGDSTSIKNIVHLSQVAASRKFQMYDYGKEMNLQKYHSAFPPLYNLSSINVPNYIIYGKGDFVANKEAVSDLYNHLSKRARKYGFYAVDHPSFAHTDFITGKDVKTLVYDHIISFLKRVEKDEIDEDKAGNMFEKIIKPHAQETQNATL